MLNTTFSRIMNISPVQRQTIITLFWQIAFTAIGFISTMYFAHAIGKDILGSYYLLVAYYSIFSMVSDGGFGGAAVKRISEGMEENEYFSAFFALRSVFVIAALLFLIMFRGYFVDLNDSGLFFWLLLILLVSVLYGAVSTGVAGSGKMGIRATCSAITNISTVIFQVAAIFFGFGAVGLVAGMAAGLLLGCLIEFHFFDLHFVRFKWHHVKSLFIFAFWLFLTSGGVLVFSQADTVLIGYFMENSDIAVYKIVLQFAMAATFTTYSLRATLWPKVSRWWKIGDITLIEESLARAFSYSLILAVPIVAGGLLLGDRLLYFFYGAEYASGYNVLMILLFVQIVNIFQYFFTMYLDAMNYPKESFKVTAIAAAANIVLDIILIPVFGIAGAAAATLGSMILNAFLAKRALSRIMKIKIEIDSLLNILKASAVMALLVGVYRWFVPLASVWLVLLPVVLGGIVYGVVILKLDKKIAHDLKTILVQVSE